MDAARSLHCRHNQQESFTLQPVSERNNKSRLYNAVVHLINSEGRSFQSDDEMKTSGIKLAKLLCDILWHIDGHHHVFSIRSSPVPSTFQSLVNYNAPELSKHRKRRTCNMSSSALQQFALELNVLLDDSFWNYEGWSDFKHEMIKLIEALSGYVNYLASKNKKMKLRHSSPVPVRELSSNLHVKYICASDQEESAPPLDCIQSTLEHQSEYEHKNISELFPKDPVKRHRTVENLCKHGISFPIILLSYSPGSNIGNLYFGWRVPEGDDPIRSFEASQPTIEKVKQLLPVYHTRMMRSALFEKFGRVSPSVKPAVLRYFYRSLTGDCSASETTDQSAIDDRVLLIIDMEDPDVVMDLRSLNTGQSVRYDKFWDECDKFISEHSAVDDRRHGTVTHLSLAISIRDFIEQVKSRCSADILIPSAEWVRLQFWPKTPTAKAALHHTGRLKVKFQVQQRQFRREHTDSHYAACIYRYMREYAVSVRTHSLFFCLDDKHKVKIGEPAFPVASAERSRRVLTVRDESFEAGDHDFTKFGIIPSVSFMVHIPETIDGSWYDGDVYVGLKDTIFEPSSPLRHAVELYSVITSLPSSERKHILFVYTDGGPDHRVTYISVQISLICLFLKLELDFLCAVRTAPYHSWRNPAERVMSVLNLGLQCVALARREMSEEYEGEVAKCNTLGKLRNLGEAKSDFIEAVKDSLSPVKVKLSQIFQRLCYKDRHIQLFQSASEQEMNNFWLTIMDLDKTLEKTKKYTKDNVADHDRLSAFMKHCCKIEHYSFSIIKCGKSDCTLCKPVSLPSDVFQSLHHLPDPVPAEDGHYSPFKEVYGTVTTGEFRPSLAHQKKSTKRSLPFYASVQHVKNAQLMVQCESCGMWRLIYSKYKLKEEQRFQLEQLLDNLSYSCGGKLKDLHLPDHFSNVEIKDHHCNDPIEKLYYSAKLEPICVYCAVVEPFTIENCYPQCTNCRDRPPIKK